MPPEKVETLKAAIPRPPATVPLLLIPPPKLDPPLRLMPAFTLLAEIVPLLVMPPATGALVTKMPFPDDAVILPWLTIDPPIVAMLMLMPFPDAPGVNVPLGVFVTLPVIDVPPVTEMQLVAPLLLIDAAEPPFCVMPQAALAAGANAPTNSAVTELVASRQLNFRVSTTRHPDRAETLTARNDKPRISVTVILSMRTLRKQRGGGDFNARVASSVCRFL